jgi:GAF domain-containing protein
VIGCLTIGFAQARDFTAGETTFLRQLAAEFGNSVAASRQLESARRAARQADALRLGKAAIRASASAEEALSALVEALVPEVVDGAAAYLVEADGSIRYITNRHRDPEQEALARELLHFREERGKADGILGEAVREGRPVVVQRVTDAAVVDAAQDAHELDLLRRLSIGSVAAVPVRSTGRVLGAVSMGNDPGRFFSDEQISSVQEICELAAHALRRLSQA